MGTNFSERNRSFEKGHGLGTWTTLGKEKVELGTRLSDVMYFLKSDGEQEAQTGEFRSTAAPRGGRPDFMDGKQADDADSSQRILPEDGVARECFVSTRAESTQLLALAQVYASFSAARGP